MIISSEVSLWLHHFTHFPPLVTLVSWHCLDNCQNVTDCSVLSEIVGIKVPKTCKIITRGGVELCSPVRYKKTNCLLVKHCLYRLHSPLEVVSLDKIIENP